MHDLLMASDELDSRRVDEFARRIPLDHNRLHDDMIGRDKAIVDAEMTLAVNLNIPGTPSFFLCCPDGKVIDLDLDQVQDYMR